MVASDRQSLRMRFLAIRTSAMTIAFRSLVSVFLLDSTLRLSPPLAMPGAG